MRKISLLLLLTVFALTTTLKAQSAFLNENFNSSCPSGIHGPAGWTVYNTTVSSGTGADQWTCDAAYGRGGTPGISCSGFYGSPAINHIDTSYFISPPLDLSGYTGSVYLNFDTKATKITLGAKLEIIAANNLEMFDTAGADSARVLAKMPFFGTPDSSDWVTHQADLTPYKYYPHLFVGFRYASATNTTTASRWFLDNINITTKALGVAAVTNSLSLFTIVGTPAKDEIIISCAASTPGIYNISIYDMVGRQVHSEQIQVPIAPTAYPIRGLQLHEGMYVVKLGNEAGYSIAKALVR